MAKRRKINGKYYRLRRGKWVEIPKEWVGKTTHNQSIRKRQSKQIRKIRMNPDRFKGVRSNEDDRCYRGSYWPSRKLGHPGNLTPRHRGSKVNKIEFEE